MIVSNPQKPLDRGVEMTRFEYYCRKIAPYVIIVCVIILTLLIFIALVKYGANWTGTESNIYYNQFGGR